MSLFSLRRQMDDLMNQMMYMQSQSFNNDPFFSEPFFDTPSLLTSSPFNRRTNTQQQQLTSGSNNNNNNNTTHDKNMAVDPSTSNTNEQQQQNNNSNNTQLSSSTRNNTSLGGWNGFNTSMSSWAPSIVKVDVHEEKDNFKITAELPGVTKDCVKVNVEDGYLSISGEKKESIDDKSNDDGRQVRRSERRYGSFQRSFKLPSSCDQNNVKAKFDNGLLTLEIPKLPEDKQQSQRRITIQ